MKGTVAPPSSNSIAASAAPVTIAVTGANTFSSTVSNTASIASGGSTTITFTGVNLSNPGTNNIAVYSNLPGDGSAANDTLRTTVISTTVTTTFPAITGAEASPLVFDYVKVLNGSRQLWALNTSFTASVTGAFKNADLAGQLYTFQVLDKNNTIKALGHFICNGKHALYLKGTNFDKADNSGSMHLLMKQAIEFFADKATFFDFGGGSKQGLANFYMGFGGQAMTYSFLQVNKLPRLIKILKNKK